MNRSDNLPAEQFVKVADLVGDDINAGVRRDGRLTYCIAIEDDADMIYMGMSDARALRDWLNKVLP